MGNRLFDTLKAQNDTNKDLLTIDRIYEKGAFRLERFAQARWTEEGKAYTTLEASPDFPGARDIVSYDTRSGKRRIKLNGVSQ